ncbi:MAG TPA: hypothetical protein VM490_16620 [Armatimonadaceae bacterium]|jgi:hypothetical protein|nr:hypothetical protein [Armatimonadaceae bacterium]
MTPEELEGLDPDRILTAAHELGHLFAFRARGFVVSGIHVSGKGDRVSGHVVLEIPDKASFATDQERRNYAVGTLAGRAAELKWAATFDVKPGHESTCQTDMRDAKNARRQMGAWVFESTLKDEAAREVTRYWRQILRLVPRLAKCGSVPIP